MAIPKAVALIDEPELKLNVVYYRRPGELYFYAFDAEGDGYERSIPLQEFLDRLGITKEDVL